MPSPEIQLICSENKKWKERRNKEWLMDQDLQDLSESPERSLLTGAIITVSKKQTGCCKQLRMSEKVTAQEDVFADGTSSPESTAKQTAASVNGIHKTGRKSSMIHKNTLAYTKAAPSHGEVKAVDLLMPLSDSKSQTIISSVEDFNVRQDQITSLHVSESETSTVQPSELLTVHSASSDVTPDLVLPVEIPSSEKGTTVTNTDFLCCNSKGSQVHSDEDCTQITDVNFSSALHQNGQLHSFEHPLPLDKLDEQQGPIKDSNAVMINSCMNPNEKSFSCLERGCRKKCREVQCSRYNKKRKPAQKMFCNIVETILPLTADTRNKRKRCGQEKYGSVETFAKDKRNRKCSELINQSVINSCQGAVPEVDNNIQSMKCRRSIRKTNIDKISVSNKQHATSASVKPISTTVAGINKRNAKGETRLHLAAKKGDLAVIKTLITAGISVNQKDYAGWTAIHEASCSGFSEVISELVKAGADVNCSCPDGIMPLHDAVTNNHLKAAEILLKHGANPNIKDKLGKRIMDMASSDEMKELLKPFCRVLESGAVCRNSEMRTEKEFVQSGSDAPDTNSKKMPLVLTSHPYETREKFDKHQAAICIMQDIEQRQKKLFCMDLQTPTDLDVYIQEMTDMQDVLNGVLGKQKADRDVLAKKYRASIDSFKQGRLREELTKMADRQRKLLDVVQKQKELGQNIKEYRDRKRMQENSTHRLTAISEEPHEEPSQYQDSSCSQGRTVDEEQGGCMLSNYIVISESIASECNSESLLQSKGLVGIGKHNGPSRSEVSGGHVACLHQESNDDLEFETQVNNQLSVAPINNIMNDAKTHAGLADRNVKKNANNMDKTSQQETTKQSATAAVPPCTFQKTNFLQKSPLLPPGSPKDQTGNQNARPEKTSETLMITKPQSNVKQKIPEVKQRKMKMADLIKLGRIKPGKDVLEFKVQDCMHKATLLLDGRIRTNNGRIYSSPVHWIKTLLGKDISVSWKYAMSKVSYLGKELSSYTSNVEPLPERCVSPYQQTNITETSSAPDPVPISTHYLQLNEIVLIKNQEFLPSHIMDQHWDYYIQCEDLAF